MSEFTRLLQTVGSSGGGDPDAAVGALYDELRRLARGWMRGERPDHTLVPTALANEAWLRLGSGNAKFATPAEFFAAASQALRRILIEHSRRRAAQKRGGDRGRDAGSEELAAPERAAHLLALDGALERLTALDPMKARLVELRFYGGLAVPEVARLLGMSERTVAREWRVARAFLGAELQEGGGGPGLDD
jgi:RNA polymerase sigma factor (TIGR02999 family)